MGVHGASGKDKGSRRPIHSRKKPTIEGTQDELNVLGKDEWELVIVQNIRLESGRLFAVVYLKGKKR